MGAVPPAAAASELSAVADSDLSPEVEQGQLATFERFASKNPFAQQAEPVQPTPTRVSDPEDGTEQEPVETSNDAKPAESAADGDGTTDGASGLGKKITLQNTADGSHYELELRTIQEQPVPQATT